MTDKELRLAIDQAFEQTYRQTGTEKVIVLRHLEKLREEQYRRACCND